MLYKGIVCVLGASVGLTVVVTVVLSHWYEPGVKRTDHASKTASGPPVAVGLLWLWASCSSGPPVAVGLL